jgi:hypothetical protein
MTRKSNNTAKFVVGLPATGKSTHQAQVRAALAPKIEIDADTWAESGGTIGMFGKAHREGRLTIISTEDGEPIHRINGVDQ